MSHIDLDFKTFSNVIDGKLTSTAQTRQTLDPATGELNARVPLSTQSDLDAAVEAARRAYPAWSRTTLEERRKAMHAYADAFETLREPFVELMIAEQGKAYGLAQDEVERTLLMIRQIPELEIEDEVVTDYAQELGSIATVRHVPIGVTCALVPWNYPYLLAWGKIGFAVWAGNTIIVKPSPDTPMGGLKLVELAARFFPPGVIQVLSGDDELGPWCTAHPGIDKISFTGSIETGRKVMRDCSRTLKRVTLELGGNDAAIVCDDADLAQVVPAIAQLALINSGQICMNVKRVFVHDKVFDEFMKQIVAVVAGMKVGPTSDHSNFIGPVQNKKQIKRVDEYFEEIKNKNFKVAFGGKRPDVGAKDCFVDPTIVEDPPYDSKIVADEPFGPIFPVCRWSGPDQSVVDTVNSIPYGLGASVWSKDVARATKMAKDLDCGIAWVNSHFLAKPKVPFGGHKDSGIGVEWGKEGLRHWMQTQSLWTPVS